MTSTETKVIATAIRDMLVSLRERGIDLKGLRGECDNTFRAMWFLASTVERTELIPVTDLSAHLYGPAEPPPFRVGGIVTDYYTAVPRGHFRAYSGDDLVAEIGPFDPYER